MRTTLFNNPPCLFTHLKERRELKGPRSTCQHGHTFHVNLIRIFLGLKPFNVEELKRVEARRLEAS